MIIIILFYIWSILYLMNILKQRTNIDELMNSYLINKIETIKY